MPKYDIWLYLGSKRVLEGENDHKSLANGQYNRHIIRRPATHAPIIKLAKWGGRLSGSKMDAHVEYGKQKANRGWVGLSLTIIDCH